MIEQYTSPVAVNNSQEPWLVGEGVVVSGGVAIPSLDFNFITGGLPGTVTFTRASTATYFNSAGVLTSAAINEARFDYNPTTLAARGLLIEEQRTNLLTRSEEFNDAAWTKTRTSITANSVNSPSNTQTADTVIEDTTASSSHFIDQVASFTSGVSYTLTVYAKDSGRRYLQLLLTSAAFGANIVGVFDLVLAVSTQNSGNTSITAVGNGWYRCALTATATVTSGATVQLRLANSYTTTPASYTGDGTSGLYIWGAQLEAGAFPTSYIPTTTTALTRSADVASVNTLSPWYSATEGTLYFEAQFYNAPNVAGSNIGALSDGTNSNRVTLGAATTFSGNINSNVSSGGVGQANPYVGSLSTVGPHKAAATYANNSFNIAVNGTLGVEDTSGVVPVGVDRLILGRAANGAGATNGWLRRTTYYPRKLSSAELQAITA